MSSSSNQAVEERFAKLRNDSNLRRETIVKYWPQDKTFISVDELVKDGFYCTGQGDRVQCCYCRGILSKWDKGDKVHEEHRKNFEQCPMVKCPYKHPEYADRLPRINSFKDWPTQLKQKPEDLADAGFFYLGNGDKTRCFWCSGILCDWESTDEPLNEHIKWFSECPWLFIIKDKQSIQDVLKKHQEKSEREAAEKSRNQQFALEQVKSMGFEQEKIDKALKNIGNCFDVGKLIQAVLEVESHASASKQREITQRPASGEHMDIKSLKRENKDLKEQSKCKICRDADIDVVFIPCGHLVSCTTCSGSIYKCPVCRQDIGRAVKVYW